MPVPKMGLSGPPAATLDDPAEDRATVCKEPFEVKAAKHGKRPRVHAT